MSPDALPLYRFKHLSQHGLCHFVTTRQGGVSQGAYASLNLGQHTGDDPAHVEENRRRLAEALGVAPDLFVFPQQVHGNRVARVPVVGHDSSASSSHQQAAPCADGLVTNTRGVCLITLAADCVSMILYDPARSAVGVAHAGWKGTALGIAGVITDALREEFGSSPSDLLVAMGPAIGPCCYQVGPEVVEAIGAVVPPGPWARPAALGRAKWMVNLWEANRLLLQAKGIPAAHIQAMRTCTHCHPELYFSARMGLKGRIGVGAML